MPGIGGCFALDSASWARTSNYHNQSEGANRLLWVMDIEPVSYSKDPDPSSPGFAKHLGYEADLLTALEAMEERRLTFMRQPVADWPGIWLLPATPEFDIVGGGITILESRTLDVSGQRAISFTSGHIAFRQSLLVRSQDAERFASYGNLTSDVRVGVRRGTTGEARLEQVREIDGELAYEKMRRAVEKASQEKARQVERARLEWARQETARQSRERGGPERDFGPSC